MSYRGSNINKCICKVTKARSYQTLIIKTGRFTYPSKHYKGYKKEMEVGMRELKAIIGEVPIGCTMTFNGKGGVDREVWRVKLKDTGNTSKLFESEQEALDYIDKEKHFMEYTPTVIRYGSIADVDNVMKPVVDLIEELNIIENDRQVVDMHIKKTFGNEEETIEVELFEMETIASEDNVSFRRRELND